MRLRTTAFVASALAGLFYVTLPSASALPAASRADITTAKAAGITEEVRHRRRHYRRGHRHYRPYRYYDYGYYEPYYYRPYYYRPYYYGGWGYPYYYRHRPGFGIYLGF
ncbi:MAG: hypothetical protein K8F92_00670 [Hyphomicrobium sp.]|uniref:hypothetical protein n=1 Tax=Hyphomicrobium sp. TaxID=82 RepID=UPI00132C0A2A|nr:hypothetical protein [Hyphomicrobium sp.]KAB2939277.1 MAG: hypothetical protein F9K20_17415 [Hyphomicrobium sp.]MBZ0208157.1 hypothetical protein [Hyphomicrobium sp.]